LQDEIGGEDFMSDKDMELDRSATYREVLECYFDSRGVACRALSRANIAIALSVINTIAIIGLLLYHFTI